MRSSIICSSPGRSEDEADDERRAHNSTSERAPRAKEIGLAASLTILRGQNSRVCCGGSCSLEMMVFAIRHNICAHTH